MLTRIDAWGDNEYGQLGQGVKSHVKTSPVKVLVDGWLEADCLIAAAGHTAAHFPDGHMELIGADDYGASCSGSKSDARLTPVRALLAPQRGLALLESHGIAFNEQGQIVTWGGNILGQIGNGLWTEGKERLEPPGAYDTPQSPTAAPYAWAVGGGQYFDLVITRARQLTGWGENQHGQLGDGTRVHKLVPTHALRLTKAPIAVDGGGQHSLVLCRDETVLGAGLARQGQFGLVDQPDVSVFAPIPGVEGCIAISAGGSTSLFLLKDGTVLEAGRGEGLRRVALSGPASAISAGTSHCLAVVNGRVEAWGNCEWGQIGDGTRSTATEDHTKLNPVDIGVEATSICAGVMHSLAWS